MKKNEFIYNEFQTKLLKALSPIETEFFGVYNYKDYVIIFDREPINKVRHISVSRGLEKEIYGEDLEKIAFHFLGKNYEIIDFQNNKKVNVVHVYEISPLLIN